MLLLTKRNGCSELEVEGETNGEGLDLRVSDQVGKVEASSKGGSDGVVVLVLKDAIDSALHVNLELSRGEVVELLEDTNSGANLLGGPVVHELSTNDLVDGGSVVEVDKESAEVEWAGAGVLETEVGILSSVPVDAPVEGGNLLRDRISNYVKAERVPSVEVGKSTFSGVRSGINEPLGLKIRGVVVKTNLEFWGL